MITFLFITQLLLTAFVVLFVFGVRRTMKYNNNIVTVAYNNVVKNYKEVEEESNEIKAAINNHSTNIISLYDRIENIEACIKGENCIFFESDFDNDDNKNMN